MDVPLPPGGGPPPPSGAPPSAAANPARGALLSDINSFNKRGLKKTKTDDRSSAVRTAKSTGGSSGGGSIEGGGREARSGPPPGAGGQGLAGFNPFAQGAPKLKSTGKAEKLYLPGGGKSFGGGGQAKQPQQELWKKPPKSQQPNFAERSTYSAPAPQPEVKRTVVAQKAPPSKAQSPRIASTPSKSFQYEEPPKASLPPPTVEAPRFVPSDEPEYSYTPTTASTSEYTSRNTGSSSSYSPPSSSYSTSSSNYSAPSYSYDTPPTASSSSSSRSTGSKYAATASELRALMNRVLVTDPVQMNFPDTGAALRTVVLRTSEIAQDSSFDGREELIVLSTEFMSAMESMVNYAKRREKAGFSSERARVQQVFERMMRTIGSESVIAQRVDSEVSQAKATIQQTLNNLLNSSVYGSSENPQLLVASISGASARLNEAIIIFNGLSRGYDNFDYGRFARTIGEVGNSLREAAGADPSLSASIFKIGRTFVQSSLSLVTALGDRDEARVDSVREGWSQVLVATAKALKKVLEIALEKQQ